MHTGVERADRPTLTYDSAGRGTPLVLVHAFPLSREMWQPQVAALADRVRVIAPDVPGFGGSPLDPQGWTIDSFADELAEFVTGHAGGEKVVLGGLSMGGYVALAVARRHPDLLRGLILADTRAEPDGPDAKANRDKMIAFAEGHGAAAVIDAMLPKMVGEPTRSGRPAVLAEARRIGTAQPVVGITAALKALRDRPDATPGLANLRVPTLVIVGEQDGLTPPDAARKMADAIPGAKLEVIPGVGHLSSLEDPERFNAAVRAFIDGLG